LRALRRGLYIALLLDQNTKPKDGGIFVDFFGLPVPMSTSAAILAERVNVPVVPLFCVAQPKGDYRIYALPPIRTAKTPVEGVDSIRDLTQKIALMFQQEIEKHPEQWMWMYKRWKHIKPGLPAGVYPYYAKPLS
jgi:KDO2-lipid IV(A) lauroyltransferase